MSPVTSVLNKFNTVTLKEIESLKLFDRVEKKFIFNAEKLPEILSELLEHYNILSIDSTCLNRYENKYFDTPELEMYLSHHNGKTNRQKVRFRNYINTSHTFFEIKLKNNKGRTIKSRIEMADCSLLFNEVSEKLLLSKTGYKPELLHQTLEVDYNRITLVSKINPERVTIDLDLQFLLDDEYFSYKNLVIAEVKQPKSSHSVFNELMHEMHVRSLSLSKYCLGIATLSHSVKSNNFKNKILYVNKVCRSRN